MWLEETAWLWLPVVGGFGVWMSWSIITLKAQTRALRARLERLEDGGTSSSPQQRRVA